MKRWAFAAVLVLGGMGCPGPHPSEADSGTSGGGDGADGSAGSGAGDDAGPGGPGDGGSTSGPPTTGDPTGADDQGDDTGSGTGCCDQHSGPGCDVPRIEDCVCAIDAACCVFGWDGACVDVAQTHCEAGCGVDDGPVACDPVQIEMDQQDAILSGAWNVTMSQLGEGLVMFIDGPGIDGAARFEPDIPCQDTWFVWVRFFNNGADDSWRVALDGQPQPGAVFESDCDPAGDAYEWFLLNWADPDLGFCQFVEDPRTADWDAGVHTIDFTFREAIALSRIIVTNDAAFAP